MTSRRPPRYVQPTRSSDDALAAAGVIKPPVRPGGSSRGSSPRVNPRQSAGDGLASPPELVPPAINLPRLPPTPVSSWLCPASACAAYNPDCADECAFCSAPKRFSEELLTERTLLGTCASLAVPGRPRAHPGGPGQTDVLQVRYLWAGWL